MLGKQKQYRDTTGLGYEKGQSSKVRETPRNKIDLSYHATTPKGKKKIEAKIKTKDEFVKINNQRRRNFRRTSPARQAYIYRYKYSFNGYCYTYNHFGHKAVNCRRNQFASIWNINVVHFKCNSPGHKAYSCKMYGRIASPSLKSWKRKEAKKV